MPRPPDSGARRAAHVVGCEAIDLEPWRGSSRPEALPPALTPKPSAASQPAGAMNTAKDRRVHPVQRARSAPQLACRRRHIEEGDLFEDNASGQYCSSRRPGFVYRVNRSIQDPDDRGNTFRPPRPVGVRAVGNRSNLSKRTSLSSFPIFVVSSITGFSASYVSPSCRRSLNRLVSAPVVPTASPDLGLSVFRSSVLRSFLHSGLS